LSGLANDAVIADRWLFQVLMTQPTTVVGVAALLAHVGQPENLVDQPDEEARESILSGASEASSELKVASRDFPARLGDVQVKVRVGLWFVGQPPLDQLDTYVPSPSMATAGTEALCAVREDMRRLLAGREAS
jgi:hypothetical protein